MSGYPRCSVSAITYFFRASQVPIICSAVENPLAKKRESFIVCLLNGGRGCLPGHSWEREERDSESPAATAGGPQEREAKSKSKGATRSPHRGAKRATGRGRGGSPALWGPRGNVKSKSTRLATSRSHRFGVEGGRSAGAHWKARGRRDRTEEREERGDPEAPRGRPENRDANRGRGREKARKRGATGGSPGKGRSGLTQSVGGEGGGGGAGREEREGRGGEEKGRGGGKGRGRGGGKG